jgi:hypothetical protein
MPSKDQLPNSMDDFRFRQAAAVDVGRNFFPQMDALIRQMDQLLQRKSKSTAPALAEARVASSAPNGAANNEARPTVIDEPIIQHAAEPQFLEYSGKKPPEEMVRPDAGPSEKANLIAVLLFSFGLPLGLLLIGGFIALLLGLL